MMQGQIIEGRGGFYTVRSKEGTVYVLRAKKKFRHQHIDKSVIGVFPVEFAGIRNG